MANYYTRTVLTESVLLTEDLHAVLRARGATIYEESAPETVLDGIVHERMPLGKYSVVFEDGWTCPCEDVDEFLVEYAGWDDDDAANLSPEARELVLADEPFILHEILKLNPELDHINMQSAWGCSKMRLDGFGGSGLIVNRKGYLYLTSNHYEIDEDGVIEPSGKFRFWFSDAQEKVDDAA